MAKSKVYSSVHKSTMNERTNDTESEDETIHHNFKQKPTTVCILNWFFLRNLSLFQFHSIPFIVVVVDVVIEWIEYLAKLKISFFVFLFFDLVSIQISSWNLDKSIAAATAATTPPSSSKQSYVLTYCCTEKIRKRRSMRTFSKLNETNFKLSARQFRSDCESF